MNEARVRIALQKSGRLAEDSLALLSACGLHVTRSKDQLFCRIKELPVDVLLLRDDDIPTFVSNGICDLGIVGENVFAETAAVQARAFDASVVTRLGFSRCRLAIAVPAGGAVKDVAALAGCTIATSYPGLLKAFLDQRGVDAKILLMKGAVEVAPRLNIADAICDVVASGATLAANGLSELATLIESEALLVRAGRTLDPAKEAIIARLVKRMRGALQADDSKYIMLHAPRDRLTQIVNFLPGVETPTVLPLQGAPDKCAVHAVCRETVFWETMEELQAAGATSILVLPIEKMMAR